MSKTFIQTRKAPAAIGSYSQAVKTGQTVFLSGQIPLDPETMTIINGDFRAQLSQVICNLQAVAIAAGGNLSHIVKLNVYLTDLTLFPLVNEVMSEFFNEPYPARAVVGVAALPKNAAVEIDGIMVLDEQEYH